MMQDARPKPLLWLRRPCRSIVRAGIGFVAARPLLHRAVALAYPLVPGLQARLRRIGAPAPAGGGAAMEPPPAPADPNARYLFQPGAPPAPGPVVTVEELYHLAAALRPPARP